MTALRNTLRLPVEIAGYVTGLNAVFAFARRALKRIDNENRLASLTDYQLTDLGIARKDIPLAAAEAALTAVPATKSLVGQLAAWYAAQEKRVATHRQLNHLGDRLLSDIGLEPDQLRAVSGTMVSTFGKIREAAQFIAQPVVEFTTAAKLSALDFEVSKAANAQQDHAKAA